MYTFTSNLQKIILFLTLVLVGVFAFAPKQVDACSVVLDNSTRFRTAYNTQGGAQPANFLITDEQSELPFVYMDVKMSGCEGAGTVYLHVLGLRDEAGVVYTVENFPVNIAQFVDQAGNVGFTQAFRADEGPCYGDNSDQGMYDCLIVGLITDGVKNVSPTPNILGVVGNILGRVSLADAADFVSSFSIGEVIPSTNCEPRASYVYRVGTNCSNSFLGYGGLSSGLGTEYSLFSGQGVGGNQRLIEYYNQNYNKTYSVMSGSDNSAYSTVGFPGLLYTCNGSCAFNDEWLVIGSPMEYGASHPDDNGPIVSEPLSSSYQDEYYPLAPLPFEGLNGGETPSLPEYISGLFEAVIIVLIVLAVIMIVFAGVTHFFSATATGKEGKRELAWNAVIGLVIALGSWVLLNTISPNLAENLSIQIPEVTLAGDVDAFPGQNISNADGSITTGSTLPTNLGLMCPMVGGSAAVSNIIDSFVNKTTYRYGGKGGPLPAGAMYPLTPNESSSNSPYMCGSVACRTFCPNDTVCLDCSGFTNQVRKCAGLPTFGGTASMRSSSSAIQINPINIASNGQSIMLAGESYVFQPGDLLISSNHVLIYYGDGKVAESRGDLEGFQTPNSNVRVTNLSSNPSKNKLTHLIKVAP